MDKLVVKTEESAGREGGMDIPVIIAAYKRHMKARGYAPKTLECYAFGLKQFTVYLQILQITDLRQVTREIIHDYHGSVMALNLATESKAIRIRAVKRLFEYLVDSHRLLINPAEGIVETSRKHRPIGTVLTVNEIKRLLDQPNLSTAIGIRDRTAMELLYATGIRSNELLNLHVYDIDIKERIVYVKTAKGGRQRVVPMSEAAAGYMKEYIDKIRPKHAKKHPKERRLFLTNEGHPLTWNAIRVQIDGYRRNAGINKTVGLHVFRRTCATHMLLNGADIRYVQKLLGHKNLKTTQQYTRVMPVDIKQMHDKMHPNQKEAPESGD